MARPIVYGTVPVGTAAGKAAQGGKAAGKGAESSGAKEQKVSLHAHVAQILFRDKVKAFGLDENFTMACLERIRFLDRPLTTGEAGIVMDICKCYAKQMRQLVLVGWVGYLGAKNSGEVDLGATLAQFRKNPGAVLNVRPYAGGLMGEMQEEAHKRMMRTRGY